MKNTIQAIILATLVLSLTQFLIAAAPTHDNWSAAELITGPSGSKISTSAEATAQGCEPMHNFPDAGTQEPARTVWFKWVVPSSGSFTFKSNSLTPQSLSAYVMAPSICNGNVVTTPHAISENQLYLTPNQTGIDTRITFGVQAGTLVFISVDGYGEGGPFTLEWERTKYRYSTQLDSRDPGTDVVITRETPSGITEWWYQRSMSQPVPPRYGAMQFGRTTDKKLMGDFNGDGVTDFAAIRPENGQLTWWIISSYGQLLKVIPFGLATDRPIVGDYDGDGRADIAVTRPEANGQKTWHFLRSSDGSYSSVQFGIATDRETVGDYDGDGKTDVVVLRLGGADYRWYILRSSDGSMDTKDFGRGGDVPQSADIDRDGKTDLIMFRLNAANDPADTAGKWYFINSNSGGQVIVKSWGQAFDRPQIGDYDADGIIDLAIYRLGGAWWVARSGAGIINFGFGQSSDKPMADLGRTNAFLTF